ncbi:MAG: DUF1957 domain-containing protein [Desulfobacterota bacterium]|nr:DUF1957 domain-containing protein [Thermodesulfobacteriota bacterium]
MASGYLILVLHAHLPYVRHPEQPYMFEELWLYEAITESYIPLIKILEGLERDRIPCRLTLSLSPPLLTMLQDRLLQQRYLKYLQERCALARAELRRNRHDPVLKRLARMYLDRFTEAAEVFHIRYKNNLISAFKRFYRAGLIELITTAATHAFLPLLKVYPSTIRAQVMTGAEYFNHVFGHAAPGMWLPECGYYEGLESYVREAGYRYLFLETHGLLYAEPRPRYGQWAPVACAQGVAAFCRDQEASRQIWSSTEGYPGDPLYREFYRDIGQDRDPAYLARYVHPRGGGIQTGIKYFRISGREEKDLYDPEMALHRAQEHAHHFVACRMSDIRDAAATMALPPAITIPFDAELFGHWWFEGPWFLDALVREVAQYSMTIEMITPSDYLGRHHDLQEVQPSGSSWGHCGYHDVWLNETNDWLYPYLHAACSQMEELAENQYRCQTLRYRAQHQAARSLLLAQASDWPFIMRTGTTVEYARARIRDHLSRFYYLARACETGRVHERTLAAIERLDAIFPDIDVCHFRSVAKPYPPTTPTGRP